MPVLDLEAFDATPLMREPYDHIIVPGFIRAEAVAAIDADFPPISNHGSFPVGTLKYGPAFAALLDEFAAPETRDGFARKFDVDLSGRPLMTTVRGQCRAKDGRIHTDSTTKIITGLIYMNTGWEAEGGRLRVLRSAHDMEDYAAEVPPAAGTLLAFRRSDRSYHGHKPHVGPRRSLQINWVTSAAVVRQEQARHRFSARLKSLFSSDRM